MSKELLIKRIQSAFHGVTLGDGIGLLQGQGIDAYQTEESCLKLRTQDVLNDWSRILPEQLNTCFSSLCFFDAEGMRFHLPAFMIAELNGTLWVDHLASTLAHLDDYRSAQFSLLNPDQKEVVGDFLWHQMQHADYDFERPHVEQAILDFWGTTALK